MAAFNEFEAQWREGKLKVLGIELSELFAKIMQGPPAVIHNVFPKEKLATVRSQVHRWGKQIEAKPPQTYIDENFHAIEWGISPRQKTPHHYHAYNFNQLRQLPDYLRDPLTQVSEPLRIFQNELTNNQADYEVNEMGFRLHTQVIHYPSGGGMLGKHTHPLEPQRIGLILACSERGKDFMYGGTYFEVDGKIAFSDDIHDMGDMLLFRFDLPHGISPVDQEDKFEHESERGRWTFVLPYY